jgi:hypothetical protein
LAQANIHTAAIPGEDDAVEAMLNRNPSLATRKGGSRNWDPDGFGLCFQRRVQ